MERVVDKKRKKGGGGDNTFTSSGRQGWELGLA